MSGSLWQLPNVQPATENQGQWLSAMLTRNSGCAYLRNFGSPRTEDDFRRQVPVITYDDLPPFLERLREGERNVLFDGMPVAFERTGGSSGGSKLIPYSSAGLSDFQYNVVPWLAHTAQRHRLSGTAYFAISPVARKAESFGNLPIGLPDGAYLGEAVGAVLMQRSTVPFEVAGIEDVDQWRDSTLKFLKAARDLELISVWSPTFLLRLCDAIADTREFWPNLKVISCWASGPARPYLDGLARMFPQAVIEPKGLLSTEAVVTVPDESGQPRLARHGYFEFRQDEVCFSTSELVAGKEYEVILTSASGLYRYATGDRVRCEEPNDAGQPVLEFVGRDSLVCDLVGEKLTDAFVGQCLGKLEGLATLVPDVKKPGYVLISERAFPHGWLNDFEDRICHNPQYAYARKLGQLQPIRQLVCRRPFDVIEQVMRARGVRLGDIKPTALRADDFWLPMFEELTN
ncbi:MAG: GH3 auxin-responsive promoter family protein [Propionivibrio sp.]|nr:GH3 auxin-responsive promoter family protein [Propionivibrio sp.]